jgi:hypothetical protein
MLTTTLQANEKTFRLYQGVTLYVNNESGKAFDVTLKLRDINIYAGGPREVLFKVYTPDGKPVVREFIPDDGVTSSNFPGRIGSWDHELGYHANLYAKGATPTIRFSAYSDPARLNSLVARTFKRSIKGGGKGIYRIVLSGVPDHYATVNISPDLPYGVAGHTTFSYGHGDLYKKSYIYVPKGTSGLFFIVVEPDLPRSRTFTLTAPDGKVLYKGEAVGGYTHPHGKAWKEAMKGFKGGAYDGKLITLEVSSGPGDYMVKLALQQPKKGVFKDYVGMGSQAVLAPDAKTAMALKGGTFVEDGELFWHPLQARMARWLKAHPAGESEEEKTLRAKIDEIYRGFRLLETSDGRGSASFTNWGYSFGYYGCKIWRPAWEIMPNPKVPDELKSIIREGLIMGGDRLSNAAGMERVNGNAFSQINVALWYCHRATGDTLQKERFELFWKRWSEGEGWGKGAGLSRSGDSQEHFSHDAHYGSYLMDNWNGVQWVKQGGILQDAEGKDDRFLKVVERYRELYSYLFCRDAKGGAISAQPWSTRTHMTTHAGSVMWEGLDEEAWAKYTKGKGVERKWIGKRHPWKGEPGPDLTVSVNGGDEWFAARRKNYYMLTFHGRLAPEWMSRSFEGQLGFGGGTLCQLTVPGKGPVLTGTVTDSYGKGMDPSNWREMQIHTVAGEMWDGSPLITAISEHEDAATLKGNRVESEGEVWNSHVRVKRSYEYKPDRIACSVSLKESDYAAALSIWSHGRKWSEVRLAYEMIPFYQSKRKKEGTTVTVADQPLTVEPIAAKSIKIDRGGFGVDIILPEERKVHLGKNKQIMILITDTEVKAEKVALQYELVPYGN